MSKTKETRIGRGALLVLFLLLASGAWSLWHSHAQTPVPVDEIVLLVPDKANFADPVVTMWLDAGSEEGLHVVAMHDSDFLRDCMSGARFKAVILPDTLHRSASDVLIGGISHYVEQGGNLMLVGDAGVLDQNDVYPRASSRLSRLAGIEYAFYDELRDKATVWNEVWGSHSVLDDDLQIPPGAAISSRSDIPINASIPVNSTLSTSDFKFARYGGETLLYPVSVTRGTYDGRTLLSSASGLVAGVHKAANGRVLFVNLPLGYLKGRTDGLLLHAFLSYFAKNLLQLPSLTAVPEGIGGIVLNWHLDSNAALAPLQLMHTAGIFEQGPYSIHLTAGPDAREFGDGLGLNVDGDPRIQSWIHYFSEHGHAVGSHGGWIHDYFGLHVNDGNQKEFEKFLVFNKEALEKVSGVPVREYSAPVGTQPLWITDWLQQRGVLAYYFTGNAGMAPTQTYMDGRKADIAGWSFPISHLGRVASFEEMSREQLPDAQLLQWLEDLANFCADRHTVRLFYSHPPGVIPYLGLMQDWLTQTAQLSKENNFRWYTMTQLGDFLNRRKQVNWQLVQTRPGLQSLIAHDSKDLAQMAWIFPTSMYEQPKVLEGNAVVLRKQQNWLVIARSGTIVTVELPQHRGAASSERQP
jgi:hypothetical protein